MRLQKYLAERGVASRRGSAVIIADGRILVNGTRILEPGYDVRPDDEVLMDGKQLPSLREKHRTILLNKPRGYICSRSSAQGKTVFELVTNIPERLVTVGRLDKNSEGLIIMTNNGDLANRLSHPRYKQEKIYEVTVSGRIDKSVLNKLNSRMVIDEYRIEPVKVSLLKESSVNNRSVLEFVLTEGRNRQIRSMCRLVSLTIHRLVRTRIKNITLKGLEPGQWREIDEKLLV